MERRTEWATWQPRVTALVPCFNAAEFISRTLDSLAAQSWPSMEILIGDDCSSDDTVHTVSEFAQGRYNVRLVLRDQNMGWLGNSNDLMAQAKGELMFFAFHDDIVAPGYVEKLVEALRDNPQAVLSYSDMMLTELDGRRWVLTLEGLSGLRSSLARGFLMAREPNWWIPNRGLFRASVFHRIGGMKPNDQGEYLADWPWMLHMSLLGEFVRVPEVLCYKFMKRGSVSKQWAHDDIQQTSVRRAIIGEIRQSPLGALQKMILISYVRGASNFLPAGLKSIAKRVLQLRPHVSRPGYMPPPRGSRKRRQSGGTGL